MASCGETPTTEALAATKILREKFPELKIRFVNVVDLFKLQSSTNHPHGLDDSEYDALFTKKKPIIFAYHGYPHLIHQLSYKRANKNMHVHGYIEEGTITTTFDMKVQNKLDRYHLVMDALKYLPELGEKRGSVIEWCKDKLIEHDEYIREYGVDMPEIANWTWE
jgi:xylulose-5-phosphate/fructose-6-phosphate phosphoketolase